MIWSLLNFILIYHLRETRVISMFLAYTALLYFISLTNFRQTLASDLNVAMEELEAINENLTDTNQDLKTARNITRIDLDMAVNVQKTILNMFTRGILISM